LTSTRKQFKISSSIKTKENEGVDLAACFPEELDESEFVK
jgi:hypothetical protein